MPSGHATFVHSQSEKTNTPAGDLLDAERLFLLFRKKVRNCDQAVPEILDAMIEKAKGGSQQHAKFLFDWTKLDPTFPSEEEESGPSLAQILLDKLREDTSESASASTTEVL